jgi:hypothetical protein
MKRIFQAFKTILQLVLIIDIFLFPIFLIDYWIDGSTVQLEYLLWSNVYVLLFGTIFGSLNDKVIYRRVMLFFIIILIIFIISSFFFKYINTFSEHFYCALISLFVSSKLSNVISLLNSNLKKGFKKIKSVKAKVE